MGVAPAAKSGGASVARRARGGNDAGTNDLMLAAHMGDVDKLKELMASGADVDESDLYGWTSLRYAVRSDRRDAVEALIEGGADVNKPSKTGRTPLMSAAGNGLSHMVRMLIKGGADKTVKCANGMTAWDLANRGGSVGCTACREMLAFKEHEVPVIKADIS